MTKPAPSTLRQRFSKLLDSDPAYRKAFPKPAPATPPQLLAYILDAHGQTLSACSRNTPAQIFRWYREQGIDPATTTVGLQGDHAFYTAYASSALRRS